MSFAFIFDSVLPRDTVVGEELKQSGLKVPVTMRGVMVGWGEIQQDGSLVVETEKSEHGRALMKMLLNGTANCLSIGPNPKGPIAHIIAEGE